MKKTIVSFAILSTLFFSLATSMYAAPCTKDIEVTLSNAPAVMKVGETFELTATTDKHGSSYTDIWDNATKVSTFFNSETETYISEAVFTAVKPGTYTIRYTIEMTAGKSNITFSKTVERTIEVINPVTVVGARIQDLVISPYYKPDGSVSGYGAIGKIYALWSDNTTSLYGTIFFFFGPGEKSKDILVTLNINKNTYTYLVTVIR